jgi:uncharacterized protein
MPPAEQVDLPDELILEGIVVTLNSHQQPHVTPMGPRVDRAISRLTLRPYKTAQTYQNLRTTGCGVFHVTDDVELLARAAIGNLHAPPALVAIENLRCPRLADACRWFAFDVATLDDAEDRTTIDCRIVARGNGQPFFGFNRAKHAVVEAAILATRIRILPAEEIRREMDRLAVLVQKTAGAQERRAFALLRNYIEFPPLTPDS